MKIFKLWSMILGLLLLLLGIVIIFSPFVITKPDYGGDAEGPKTANEKLAQGLCGGIPFIIIGIIFFFYARRPEKDLIKLTETDSLEIKASLGWMTRFIGMIIFLFGIMIMDEIVLIPGVIIALSGICYMLFARGAIINRKDRTVVTWWGFIVPLVLERHNLINADTVMIKADLEVGGSSGQSGGGSVRMAYHISLKKEGTKGLFLVKYYSKRNARIQATRIARFLELNFLDSTVDPAVFQEKGSFDTQDRLPGSVSTGHSQGPLPGLLQSQLPIAQPLPPPPPTPPPQDYLSEVDANWFCPECDTELDGGSIFCQNCGFKREGV